MARAELAVAGFSQGAAMALSLALAPGAGEPPSRVLALSGFVPDVVGHEHDLTRADGIDVLMQNGTDDDTVPIEIARDSAALLQSAGASITAQEYPSGHHPTLDSLAAAQRWLESDHSPAASGDD